ncbi:MAG TPA: hypothetical protein PKM72_06660 [Nitrospirales bacterium]|nr:hypothetical protein [Nitrospira sp. MA-1]HNP60503.1 hypothetical protein [Nitrospirales bacterium]
MIRTEQLAHDTIMFHVRGQFNKQVAKELSLSVFRSYHLGFKTFLCNLYLVMVFDKDAHYHLTLIGEGLRVKGRNWRVIRPPSSSGNQLILRTNLQLLTPANLN